ncbi:MAG: MepB family protein [Bacteroidia bacterium]|nr:MepB family protein [Bacteroidia bacterium]
MKVSLDGSEKNKDTASTILFDDLKIVKELIYDRFNFHFTKLQNNPESAEYSACSYELNEKKIQHRASKITPTKVGQFVTIWKRNKEGITEPFNVSDELDFIVVTSANKNQFGLFIFPKSVLSSKGIITSQSKAGKRGIRVYPPWDITTNEQARKTQAWQKEYFLEVSLHTDLSIVQKLFYQTH